MKKEHQILCKGKPTMLKNEYDQDTRTLKFTCINCNKVVLEYEFKVEKKNEK